MVANLFALLLDRVGAELSVEPARGAYRFSATPTQEVTTMNDELSGRVAVVAGATRGAGRAVAVELARAGAFVYATGRSSRVTGPSDMARRRFESAPKPRH